MNNPSSKSTVVRRDSGSLHFAFVLASLWLLMPPPISAVQVSPGQTSVLYVNKFFEVRDHDVPTKYVWNGSTRVARVTGSLADTPRQQRLRVYGGWNLVSLAVSLSNASEQLLKGGMVDAAFLWNRSTRLWEPVGLGGSVPSGSVLWLRSKQEAIVPLSGVQLPPGPQSLAGEGDFVTNNDLEVLSLSPIRSPVTTNTAMFAYEAWSKRWISWLPPPLGDLAAEPPCLAPGEALFVRAEGSIELPAPDGTLRIRYFHQDHLGSSSCVSDSRGAIVEEAAIYPFGAARHSFQPRGIQENYQFTQKERDKETALDYFEARYLRAGLGRFASVDPAIESIPPGWLGRPQSFNSYGYSLNSPVALRDTTGLDVESAVRGFFETGLDIIDQSAGDSLPSQIAATALRTVNEVARGVVLAPFELSHQGYEFGVNPGLRTIPVVGATGIALGETYGEAYLHPSVESVSRAVGASANAVALTLGGVQGVRTATRIVQPTEVVQRAMSNAELRATGSSGLLRGGRSGTHYVSDAVNRSASRAHRRLALPVRPDVRVTLEVPSGRFGRPSRVQPAYGMPGGGLQRTASGNIPVRILRVQKY